MIVDTHCHPHFPDFDEDRREMFQRARAAGVSHWVAVGTDPETNEAALRVASGDVCAKHAAGLHPHSAHEAGEEMFERIGEFVRRSSPCAIGEIGLDYFKSRAEPGTQQAVFARMVRLALEHALPVIVHSREAAADTFSILERESGGRLRGVMHCFSYGSAESQRAVRLGLHVSFAGNITYKSAGALLETAALVPLDRLVLETDSPYLAPRSQRGKRNEPAFLRETLECLAAKRGMRPEELAAATTANAKRLFGWEASS